MQKLMGNKNSGQLFFALFMTAALAALVSGGLVYAYQTNQQAKAVVPAVKVNPAMDTLYTEGGGLQLRIPAGWVAASVYHWALPKPGEIVESIGWQSQDGQKINSQAACLGNNYDEPESTTPLCKELLAGLTSQQKINLASPGASTGSLYLLVYDDPEDQPLNVWLTKRYAVAGTQLQNYKPGKPIQMAGQSGYISHVGCCGGYSANYVIRKGHTVYELGTHSRDLATADGDNTFLRQIAATATFAH